MKKYFSEKFQKAKRNFDDIRAKVIVRSWNMAKRMDLGHNKGEKKKGSK